MKTYHRIVAAIFAVGLATSAIGASRQATDPTMFTSQRTTMHRGSDDLLTAGLGINGLRAMAPPVFADPEHPTASELRKRAIWSNWRGIADLTPTGGYGVVYGSTADVPGREFSAYATVAGAHQPHRVMVQLPDGFDTNKRCLLVTASSGSRGIYGSIAVAGAWGLPKGCAVAYTDKGAGTDYYDLDTNSGSRADGTLGTREDALAFTPDAPAGSSGVAIKHAQSQDNPEADWGRHVRQAAQYGLQVLNQAYPDAEKFTFANTRVIAVGISNGGGAVLRAAELDNGIDGGSWLQAVVAGEPNIVVEGGRPLYDYVSEAALLMPCALLDMQGLPQTPLSTLAASQGALRCASLAAYKIVQGSDTKAQATSAHAVLNRTGWTDAALRSGTLSVDFDLWRAVAVTYASAHGRYAVGAHPCGYSFAAQSPDLQSRNATSVERAAWWADASGVAPGTGVGIVDTKSAGNDPALPGLQCLRALWDGKDADARRVQAGVAQTKASLPRKGLPVIVIHGIDDGLVPPAFSSKPYVAMVKAAGRDVRYWQVHNVQHFDAFLALPNYGARYLPLLPYVYAALDQVAAHLDNATKSLPNDAVITNVPRADKPLSMDNLAIPH